MGIFGKDFLWGSATSAHQVEGNNTLNDWWRWEEAGRAKDRSLGACDHYHLYEQDFDMAKSLCHNAHRFSLEWSRIEAQEFRWDEKEIQHYKDVIRALRTRAIEPVVTLHHFTLPRWVSDKGGFLNPDTVGLFEKYALKAAEEFGKDVHYWITVNEPYVLATVGYLNGKWPPGETSFPKTASVIRNLLIAHAKAYRAIHRVYKKNGWPKPEVSFSKNIFIFQPCREDSFSDRVSTVLRSWFYNHLYFSAIKTGFLFFPGLFFEYRPEIKGALDFLGINYYTRHFIKNDGWGVPGIFGSTCMASHHACEEGKNTLGWDIYSKGIFDIAAGFYKRYNLPIIITENGICTDEDENDKNRWIFIMSHVKKLRDAARNGAKIKGYFYWSLLDNFEWADGYAPRFGLVKVDYATQKRYIRESAKKYAKVCEGEEVDEKGRQ